MEQLLLNIHLPRKKSLDNFIVGKNNESIEAIQNFVKSTDQLFIFIWGNEGSGKSHLASAVEDYGISVDLSGKDLNEVPAAILKQRSVVRLDISKNNLTLLPAELGE